MPLPILHYSDILEWADAHHRRPGEWPKYNSRPIADAPGETWRGVHNALRDGKRSLPGGSSVWKLLNP